MSVLLPDGTYGVIANRETITAQGGTVRTYSNVDLRTFQGRRVRQTDPSVFHVALEPQSWPIARLDLVVFPDGRQLVVDTAVWHGSEDPSSIINIVSYVQIEGRLLAAPVQVI